METISVFLNSEEARRMKAELQCLRRKGALKPSADWDSTTPDPDRSCGRCRIELGRVINRGAYCRSCRLKVCKGCREYSFRTTDWVCTVCHKRMEIQAQSGEWMNQFVRRPSRKRDSRVYVPAADIIKRTIRRSWTISNPTPRWNSPRGSPITRPYSSLPRGQEVDDYPSLVTYKSNAILTERSPQNQRHSPAQRSHSEDVYTDRVAVLKQATDKEQTTIVTLENVQVEPQNNEGEKNERRKSSPRINPLIKAAAEGKLNRKAVPFDVLANKPKDTKLQQRIENDDSHLLRGDSSDEKRVSFEDIPSRKSSKDENSLDVTSERWSALKASPTKDKSILKPLSKSLDDGRYKSNKVPVHTTLSLPGDTTDIAVPAPTEVRVSKENVSVEQFDIEHLSGAVFRKVTLRRRRQDMKKVAAIDDGGRKSSDSDLMDVLLPEGDEYKLAFLSSDSSSKEEDVDDNDSSSASSFPIDECDWDYFEPSNGTSMRPPLLHKNSSRVFHESPLTSPLLYRKAKYPSDTGPDDDTTARLDSASSSSDRSRENEEHMEDISVQCVHQFEQTRRPNLCQSCGSPTQQFIPIAIPFPVPIPVPVSGLEQNLLQRYQDVLRLRGLPRSFWAYMNQAALIWPLITAGESYNLLSMAQNISRAGECAMVAPERNKPSVEPHEEFISNSPNEGGARALTNQNDSGGVETTYEVDGHLTSENAGMSSAESQNSTDEEADDSIVKVHKSYNVNGGNMRESDDALPSSDVSSSGDESSQREDDMSSSGSADTDSNDTGTVADQKPKRFSRVLVVSGGNLSSGSTSPTGSFRSESSDIDSSDNDTDTEIDCGVVLTHVKILSEDFANNDGANVSNGEISLAAIGILEDHKKHTANSISPALSDVNAETHQSSDSDIDLSSLFCKQEFSEDVEYNALVISEVNNASTSASIRSVEPPMTVGNGESKGERAGVSVHSEYNDSLPRNAARYTSLVMITQEPAPSYPQVSVVTSDTTTLVPDSDITVQHTNWHEKFSDAFLEQTYRNNSPDKFKYNHESVTVVTSSDTLSAVVSLEDGLADDDSWVENLSNDEDDLGSTATEDSSSGDEITLSCTAAIDHEDELRGYHRSAIDFTLHTIVEESCEESEVELPTNNKKHRPNSVTDLEKYFFFGLGDGVPSSITDEFSETSSMCSEGLDSLENTEETARDDTDPAELASSRLEKYFLSGFMGFTSERRDSDGSVGSDSEGHPSPEQRRKRLVRARGAGRSHSSSLDNLIEFTDHPESSNLANSDNASSSSDTDSDDETNFDKHEGQFDTVKRKKSKKGKNSSQEEKLDELPSDEETKTLLVDNPSDFINSKKQQSRDSGFVGSSDDVTKEREATNDSLYPTKLELKFELEKISEECKRDQTFSTPPATSLTRKDSFNNWSSDEETNLMMCKMRQFFKTMIANSSLQKPNTSTPSTPILGELPKLAPSPRLRHRYKPPQLVYFENELTRLMKTVPGIRDDQVREIVEYLSSEDTWSDSYDSSDYTSSDLECNAAVCGRSLLQEQISHSCQEIINKFDVATQEVLPESCGLNRETAFVYQKLVASFEKVGVNHVNDENSPHNSPPLIAKVMHHIGSRLVALMHEVSSGESHASNSPRPRHYHRRIHPKLSNASSTTTEEDEGETDIFQKLGNSEEPSNYSLLPRSRSHDLLLSEARALHQSSSGVSDIAEEREASDYERFSWRGSFESALMATDSRNKLSLLGSEGSASASALVVAAKRRSAGDLIFSHKSREHLDRVRSCGSIGGGNSEDKLWVSSAVRPNRRRSSVPDAASGSGGSADGEDDDDDEDLEGRATLPRTISNSASGTNSLPRLPTTASPTPNTIFKAHSVHHFLQQNVKSARYRPPGFNKFSSTVPKRAVSAPGLQPLHQRRGRRSQPTSLVIPNDDVSISEAGSSPALAKKPIIKSATPSPVLKSQREASSVSSQDWHSKEDDIDRLVAIHHTRSSLSSLGVRSDSMASVYSGAGEGRYGEVTVKGQVEFGLQYNYKANCLEILIKQCKDLAAVDIKRNRSDPYVKVYLLPDKSKSGKRKTRVKKHTLNPIFDESLKFNISLNGLETRTLWLTVWHSDMFGRNDFLGEVMMTLENKVFDDPSPKWYNLQERTEPFEDVLSFKGDILVGLKFVPPDMTVHKKGKRSRGALHVKVKEARSLTAVKAIGVSDPFCKSYLLPDKGRNAKQKTAVVKKTVNPVWNHMFIYDDVTLQELAERCLELTVWDHDRLGSNEFLGGVRFSLGTGKHYGKAVDWIDSTGKELTLWKSMLERPNFWVEGCLPLRPTLDNRTT